MSEEAIYTLRDSLLSQFELIYSELGELYPFGTLLMANSKIKPIGIYYEELQIEEAILKLKHHIAQEVVNHSSTHSGGYCYLATANETKIIRMSLISKFSEGWIDLMLSFSYNEKQFSYGEYSELT